MKKCDLSKSGHQAGQSQRAALEERESDYWGMPKVPLKKRVIKGLGIASFCGIWGFVLIYCLRA